MASQLLAAAPDEFAEQLPELTTDIIKDVFQLRDPLTGVVVNATCGLLGQC
jgi:hypothetical protein